MTYRDVRGPITAEAAEAEPEAQRLFSRPARPISPETRALFARIALQDRNNVAFSPMGEIAPAQQEAENGTGRSSVCDLPTSGLDPLLDDSAALSELERGKLA
jgi:hypothetical protein